MFHQGQAIIDNICREEDITLEVLRSRKRTKTIARIRHRVAQALRGGTSLSWGEIGELLGRTASYRGGRARK